MIAWVKLLAWAEFLNVGLILVAIGVYGLIRSLTAPKPPGTLSATVRWQLEEILRESEKATEKR